MIRNLSGRFLIFAARLYQGLLSPLFGGACRFTPSCSAYFIEAVRVHGPWRGLWLGGRRLLRCRPFGPCGPDPVPPLHPLPAGRRPSP